MRIKRGETKRAKKQKVLKLTKGYRMSYSKLYRRAKEALLHAGQYSYAHRKHRRAQMRNEWIKIIAAGLAGTEMSYSKFINALKIKKIELDRKVLAEMAVNSPESFKSLVETVKA